MTRDEKIELVAKAYSWHLWYASGQHPPETADLMDLRWLRGFMYGALSPAERKRVERAGAQPDFMEQTTGKPAPPPERFTIHDLRKALDAA